MRPSSRAVEPERAPGSVTAEAPAHPAAALSLADWRFLLPAPPPGGFEHLVLLGGAPGLAARVIETGLARKVSCTHEGQDQADAVVVLNGRRIALERAAAGLRRGGIFYYEVDRRARGRLMRTPRRVCRQMQHAGLTPLGGYAIWPGLTERRTYLPLDVPGAFRWYLSTLHLGSTPGSAVLGAGLRALLRIGGHRVDSMVPCFAIVARAGGAAATAPSVLAEPALRTRGLAEGLRPLVLADSGNRVVMLPFARDGQRPLAVLKVPKLPVFNGRTENEHRVLSALAPQLDARLRANLPRTLGLIRWGAISVGVESYRPGPSLSRSIRHWGTPLASKVAHLHAAARWLGEFHRTTEISRSSWGVRQIERWVDGPFEAYRRTFGLTEREERLFARSRLHAGSLLGTPFPIVWQHRDFNVWNIFRSRGAFTVIDWEGGRPGPALCDLLHFVMHWHAAVRRMRLVPGFHRLFFSSDPPDGISRAAGAAVAAYAQRLDLHRRFFPLLLVYTSVELALRRAEQQRDQGDVAADPRAGNQNFVLIDTLASHCRELFADEGFHPLPG